ncbi:MAG: 3-phosphoshikimate 1-carboxyvinyltransferase [Nitrospirota bacterium]
MDKIEISRARIFRGEFSPPPDKSISHRAVILSSLSKGKSSVKNLLRAKDTESTINAFRAVGINIVDQGDNLIIYGKGLHGLSEPRDIIDCGNSGTTIRLVSGVLSGNRFFSVLTGDSSLRARPMARVIKPLSLMGAEIIARSDNQYPPIAIKGARLNSIKYSMPVASAQVKSSILLAGLYCDGETEIAEPAKSRDHTERMLPAFGADIEVDGLNVKVKGGRDLSPVEIKVPGDFSSAAFFIVASLLIPGGEIIVKNVGINPTRTGLLEVLGKMGAHIEITNLNEVSGEPVGDIYCKCVSRLKAVRLSEEAIPSLVDEFPVLCVAAALSEGTTTIRGARELRVKESDRIKSITSELRKMGAEIEEYPDGLSIKGSDTLHGAEVDSHEDHRIAMSMAVAALTAEGKTIINGASSVEISFPEFFSLAKRLSS